MNASDSEAIRNSGGFLEQRRARGHDPVLRGIRWATA
jgi:hypothetical protein